MSGEDKLIEMLKESITEKDIPSEDLRWVSQVIGLEATLRLILGFGGTPIYIPIAAKTHLQREYARRAFNGSNSSTLAISLGVSQRTIYDWVRERAEEAKCAQGDLFGERVH